MHFNFRYLCSMAGNNRRLSKLLCLFMLLAGGDCYDEHGRRQVVKNGRLPDRELLTRAGAIPVTQGRLSYHERLTFVIE